MPSTDSWPLYAPLDSKTFFGRAGKPVSFSQGHFSGLSGMVTGEEQVHRHLDQHEVRYLQFAFRWMNNLLMREVPLHCTIRLWDTYQ
ncbi:hypothetical protein GH733_019019, partial [Mirounga leonina]